MQNSAICFFQVKSFQIVNEQLCWEQRSIHCDDWHSPPHALRIGLDDDRSPPGRLAAVARSGPWTTPLAQVGFSGDVIRRRRLPCVVGSGLSANNTDEGGLYPKSLHRNTFNSNWAWLCRLFGIGLQHKDENWAHENPCQDSRSPEQGSCRLPQWGPLEGLCLRLFWPGGVFQSSSPRKPTSGTGNKDCDEGPQGSFLCVGVRRQPPIP